MLSVREVGLVAQREMLRNLRSTKGIAMLALFLVCGLLPSLVEIFLRQGAVELGNAAGLGAGGLPEQARQELYLKALEARYGTAEIATYLAQAPSLLHGLYAGSLVFLPFFILPIGFDQLAGEIQHRAIRYSAARADRTSIVVGKAVGIWGVVAIMVLALHVTVWIIAAARGQLAIGPMLSWGGRFWLFCVVASAAFVGYGSLVSSLVRTPIVALFVGIGGSIAMAFLYLLSYLFPKLEPITWLHPVRYESFLVSPDPVHVLGGMALLVGWGAMCVAAASVVVNRRDI
jgi:ABC-type transport system involved in multi-copper enzyme maturation permease subunit